MNSVAPVHETAVPAKRKEREHTWSIIYEGGAFHSEYCTVCDKVRLKSHEYGSNKKLGWQIIGACAVENQKHSFEQYIQESGLLRVCTGCFVQQKYGKKFGTRKTCGFEPIHGECTPTRPILRAVYQQVIAKFPEYKSAEVARNETEENIGNIRARIEQIQLGPVKDLEDFRAEFPLFSVVRPDLLSEALTHPTADIGCNYMRLAFLGDAVLGLFVIDKLLVAQPGEDNGTITIQKSKLIANHTLSVHGLPYLVYMRRETDIDTDVRVPCDVLKALIGAYYLQFDYRDTYVLCKELGIVQKQIE